MGAIKTRHLTPKPYLTLIEKIGVEPNFYMSKPYLDMIDAKCYQLGSWYWVEADGWVLFPIMSDRCESLVIHGRWNVFNYTVRQPVWCDIEGYTQVGTGCLCPEFLDYEYLFNPLDFNDMSGGRWQIYRKNSRKWQKSHQKWEYTSRFDDTQVQRLLSEWLDKKGEGVQDGELIVRFCLEDIPGVRQKYLYADGELKAVNVWDENYRFINYRVCVTRDDAWLNEIARLCFYRDVEIQEKGKLVNDGGSLGNEGLERFKDKMNPVVKRKRYSWVKNNQNEKIETFGIV